MFADSPAAATTLRRIVEDAKEDERIARIPVGERGRRELKAERHALHECCSQLGQRGDIFEDRVAQPRVARRIEVCAVQRYARAHPRMVRRQVQTEVEALLVVGGAGRELGAEGKISAPGPPPALHRDLHLRREVAFEETSGTGFEAQLEPRIDAMTDGIKKSRVATGCSDGLRRLPAPSASSHERRHVHNRYRHGAAFAGPPSDPFRFLARSTEKAGCEDASMQSGCDYIFY